MSIPKLSAVLASVVCVAAIACGSTSPVSPRGTSSLFSTGGAVITGHVNGSPVTATAQSATARPMASPTTVTVTIVGTDITTTVDGKGDFQLTGVPPGDVTLNFASKGASATITLSGVAAGDRIHIVVTLNGKTAKIEDEDRDHDDDGDDDNELKGLVSALTGTCPTLTFTVVGIKVVTNSATKFDDPCQQIANGRRVEVEGTRQTDGSIVATKVEFD